MKRLDKITYVERAEKVIQSLEKNNRGAFKLNSNQIRTLLSMMNALYLMVQHQSDEVLSEEIQSQVQYTKMKFAYQAGRDNGGPVKELLTKAELLEQFDQVGTSREYLLMLCHYMEALVAYHKYYS